MRRVPRTATRCAELQLGQSKGGIRSIRFAEHTVCFSTQVDTHRLLTQQVTPEITVTASHAFTIPQMARQVKESRQKLLTAAAALPPLLKSNPHCFRWAMTALNLDNMSTAEGNSNNADLVGLNISSENAPNKALYHMYRQLYLDSIPSFAIWLEHEVKAKHVHLNETTDPEPVLLRLLQQLIHAGFDNTQFTRKHRKMLVHQSRQGEVQYRVQQKASELQTLQEQLRDKEMELDAATRCLSEQRENEKNEALAYKKKGRDKSTKSDKKQDCPITVTPKSTPDSSDSVLTASWSMISQYLFAPSTSSSTAASSKGNSTESTVTTSLATPVNDSLSSESTLDISENDFLPYDSNEKRSPDEQGRKYTVAQIRKLRNTIQNLELRIMATNKAMRNAQSVGDSLRAPLTSEQFTKANNIMSSVLQQICKDCLASYIQTRYKERIEQYRTLNSQTDLTRPHEWYPYARLEKRKIIFHGGPTNSGKTYQALQHLKEAKKGLYVGPLRLLAAEVYETLTSEGVYTNLLTGQDKREIPFATHTAATVEMTPINEDYDVVVIDEIQMLCDRFRGFAWTRALLGIRCKEVHVCGGMEACELVRKIAKCCGDDFDLRTYQRFTELRVANTSLAYDGRERGSYSRVLPGDCVVAFSRNDIFAIKREIETMTEYKCCVIYGSLPPETRTDQARKFNDVNSGYDILVASDAIGMGLNLNIRRIIFNSLYKSNGDAIVKLDHSSVKQIAGRAGRRNSQYPSGEVTCRDPEDLKYLQKCMSSDVQSVSKAGLLPSVAHVEQFCAALKIFNEKEDVCNLDTILRQFDELATLHGDYFLCRKFSTSIISKWMEELPLSVGEKFVISMSPLNYRDKGCMETLQKFIWKYAAGETPGLNRDVYPRKPKSFEDLDRLCSIYSQLELFQWLSLRLSSNLVEQQTAEYLRDRTTTYINEGLMQSEKLKLNHCYITRDARLRAVFAQTQDGLEPFDRDLVNLDPFATN